ncbi:MAG: hypothetical protein COA78_31430 [Blastopirellula sp.]|nr:MAG: hypothetical protein COA78_31430 [Blastopirellula sp.]
MLKTLDGILVMDSMDNMEIMTLFQQFIDDGCFYAHADERNAGEFQYIANGIAGEGGEVIEQIKKITRVSGFFAENDDKFREEFVKRGVKILEETSDVLWYVTRMCTLLDITIGELMLWNTFKLYNRHYPKNTDKEIPWPYKNIPYDDALKLTQRIESRITDLSVLTSMVTDTLSTQSVADQ